MGALKAVPLVGRLVGQMEALKAALLADRPVDPKEGQMVALLEARLADLMVNRWIRPQWILPQYLRILVILLQQELLLFLVLLFPLQQPFLQQVVHQGRPCLQGLRTRPQTCRLLQRFLHRL